MSDTSLRGQIQITALTLLVGGLGAGLGWTVGLPLYLLTGPAILVSLVSLAGLRLKVIDPVRNFAFLFIGIGIGAGVNAEAAAAVLRWPLAFAALAVMIVAAMALSRVVLTRAFGFDGKSAVLASAPGHLSFVIALGDVYGVNLTRVSVVQSVRVLLLTLTVPAIAAVMGLDMDAGVLPQGARLSLVHLAVLTILSVVAGKVLGWVRVPAPLLIGAMLVSSTAHLTDLAPGVLDPRLTLAGLVIMGTLIGSRFVGVTPLELGRYALAGSAITAVMAVLALGFAAPVAWLLDMPLAHVLVSFAPGGLETMIVMGAVLGANPGFVAACHVGRLLLLSVLIPMLTARAPKAPDTLTPDRAK